MEYHGYAPPGDSCSVSPVEPGNLSRRLFVIEYATAKLYFRERSILLRCNIEIFILLLYNILYKISNIPYIFLSFSDSPLFLGIKGFRAIIEKSAKKYFYLYSLILSFLSSFLLSFVFIFAPFCIAYGFSAQKNKAENFSFPAKINLPFFSF